jgi:hypothetical protein
MRDFPFSGLSARATRRSHGLVRGELVIHEGLSDTLPKGLFATSAT